MDVWSCQASALCNYWEWVCNTTAQRAHLWQFPYIFGGLPNPIQLLRVDFGRGWCSHRVPPCVDPGPSPIATEFMRSDVTWNYTLKVHGRVQKPAADCRMTASGSRTSTASDNRMHGGRV